MEIAAGDRDQRLIGDMTGGEGTFLLRLRLEEKTTRIEHLEQGRF